ncbi:hypothetical protein [Streptomyces doebereineriae]|uniref:Uncharacterized protein n=1 Tax=Streptomyces doebereineriae TaxID=3075528 RepID=A0ABU2V162_9ACTN|nr:hypothetical protein [Streptomyces sp. DSM 41640]MDT0479300.1 hypothetical protein [Streptomyces sp. DSM 41640]
MTFFVTTVRPDGCPHSAAVGAVTSSWYYQRGTAGVSHPGSAPRIAAASSRSRSEPSSSRQRRWRKNEADAVASPVEYASLEFSCHQAANLGSVCLAALNAFLSDASDHGHHCVSPACGTP